MLTDDALVTLLRQTVAVAWKGPERDSITVNTVRAKAETQAKLQTGFFAQDVWKKRSKEIIKDECVNTT